LVAMLGDYLLYLPLYRMHPFQFWVVAIRVT